MLESEKTPAELWIAQMQRVYLSLTDLEDVNIDAFNWEELIILRQKIQNIEAKSKQLRKIIENLF